MVSPPPASFGGLQPMRASVSAGLRVLAEACLGRRGGTDRAFAVDCDASPWFHGCSPFPLAGRPLSLPVCSAPNHAYSVWTPLVRSVRTCLTPSGLGRPPPGAAAGAGLRALADPPKTLPPRHPPPFRLSWNPLGMSRRGSLVGAWAFFLASGQRDSVSPPRIFGPRPPWFGPYSVDRLPKKDSFPLVPHSNVRLVRPCTIWPLAVPFRRCPKRPPVPWVAGEATRGDRSPIFVCSTGGAVLRPLFDDQGIRRWPGLRGLRFFPGPQRIWLRRCWALS